MLLSYTYRHNTCIHIHGVTREKAMGLQGWVGHNNNKVRLATHKGYTAQAHSWAGPQHGTVVGQHGKVPILSN